MLLFCTSLKSFKALKYKNNCPATASFYPSGFWSIHWGKGPDWILNIHWTNPLEPNGIPHGYTNGISLGIGISGYKPSHTLHDQELYTLGPYQTGGKTPNLMGSQLPFPFTHRRSPISRLTKGKEDIGTPGKLPISHMGVAALRPYFQPWEKAGIVRRHFTHNFLINPTARGTCQVLFHEHPFAISSLKQFHWLTILQSIS